MQYTVEMGPSSHAFLVTQMKLQNYGDRISCSINRKAYPDLFMNCSGISTTNWDVGHAVDIGNTSRFVSNTESFKSYDAKLREEVVQQQARAMKGNLKIF